MSWLRDHTMQNGVNYVCIIMYLCFCYFIILFMYYVYMLNMYNYLYSTVASFFRLKIMLKHIQTNLKFWFISFLST